ncbi:putative LysM domain-containing protein [Helianthus annuus]|uniref:LysM domain-containing protein n=1 Tax=Helianthus annuus TaxID=4232 RepID=A0A251UKP8_HELAN|nr:putative LysM domain-containing protein [Helianthus annuus]KAJ0921191.1 putative LysM domain-containing protein [Helianthus annuus]
MAKINNKAFVYMLFVVVLVGIMTTTALDLPITTPICASVIGVKSGDTCFDIAKKFKLSSTLFNFINPNLNCDKLFVGEWICIKGI